MESGQARVLFEVAAVFERLNIPYVVGGSVASSRYGEPRATHDVDLLVDLRTERIHEFVAAFGSDFHVDEDDVATAVARASSFNLIHFQPIEKIDVFVAGSALLDREQLERRVAITVDSGPVSRLYITSAEVIVLRKLDWFRRGGLAPDRQWRDVCGVLKLQAERLDRSYLRRVAEATGLEHLLRRALADAGLDTSE